MISFSTCDRPITVYESLRNWRNITMVTVNGLNCIYKTEKPNLSIADSVAQQFYAGKLIHLYPSLTYPNKFQGSDTLQLYLVTQRQNKMSLIMLLVPSCFSYGF